MSSLKLRKLDVSKSESLLATVGSRRNSTKQTNISPYTAFWCLKALRTMIIMIEFIIYVIFWCLYMSKTQTEVLNHQIIKSSLLTLTYLEAYYWIQNIVQSTMIIICMIFFIQFILYTDRDWIHQVKKAKDGAKMRLAVALNSHAQYGAETLPNRHIKHHDNANDCSICVLLCSCSFCFRRIGATIVHIFTVTWSEVHVLCMITCIYYILSVMLRIYHPKIKSPSSLFLINDGLTAFGMILPPFAYSLCDGLDVIYGEDHVSDCTVDGSLWEKSNKRDDDWYKPMSISILNDGIIKLWMFLMYLLQFIIFITEPITCPDKFRYFLNTMYDCWNESASYYVCDPTTSQIVFTVHILILRVSVPLLLLNTLLSFLPRSSHIAQVMHYNEFHRIVTPSAIIIMVLDAFLSNYFLFQHYSVVTWSYTALLLCFSLWQIYIFVESLTLAESAEDDQEQFYGFSTTNKASLFNYFCKGVLLLSLWSTSFVALLMYKGSDHLSQIHQNQIYRQIPSIIFAITSMCLLIPLQKVAISPSYRDYFRRKKKIKYLVTFHMICLLCTIFIIQKFIIIFQFYFHIITDDQNMKTVPYSTSFALSFASIGFHIWLFGKYCGILYPVIHERKLQDQGIRSRNSSFTSKMSLTALYQNINTTRSLSNHKQSIDSDYDNAKATSLPQRKLNKMKITDYDDDGIQDIENWNDAANVYGLKSHDVYDVEQIASFAVDIDNNNNQNNI